MAHDKNEYLIKKKVRVKNKNMNASNIRRIPKHYTNRIPRRECDSNDATSTWICFLTTISGMKRCPASLPRWA